MDQELSPGFTKHITGEIQIDFDLPKCKVYIAHHISVPIGTVNANTKKSP